MTIAQQIVDAVKDSNEAMTMADSHKELQESNQNWETETTSYLFNDDSRLIVSGVDYKAYNA